MENSVEIELIYHIIDYIEERSIVGELSEEIHHRIFNEDYYVTYYDKAEDWIKEHNLSVFEIIGDIQKYETSNFGEVLTDLSNSVSVVNMYVYIEGEKILNNIETISDRFDSYITKKDEKKILKELKNYLEL